MQYPRQDGNYSARDVQLDGGMRVLTLVLASILALSAIPVGAMLVAAPDGTLLGASTEWIRGLPFSTYLVPGLVLAGVVGGSAAAAWVLTLKRARLAPLATTLCGVIVMVWIAVQVATVSFSPLQPITFALGLTLALLGASGVAGWWLRWVAANAGAELMGLGAVAIGIAAAAPLFARARLVVAGVAVVLGAFEGLVVGAAQAATLRAVLPRLRSRAWIAFTVLGAVAAWVLGMLPSLLMHRGGGAAAPPPIDDRIQMLLAAGLGAVAGPILAAFQVRELGRHVRRAGWWLVANAVAWALGMPLVFAAASGGPGARAAVLIAAAGAVVGATHGLALVAILGVWSQARAGFSGPTSTEYGGGTSTSEA